MQQSMDRGLAAAEHPNTNSLSDMGSTGNDGVDGPSAESAQAGDDAQQQSEHEPDSGGIEGHNGDNSNNDDEENGGHNNNTTEVSYRTFICKECNEEAPWVCPFGYCIICCEKMQYSMGENRRKYQNYAIHWAAYQEALHTCDTGTIGIEYLVDFETFLGLVELVHTNLTFNDTSHALVAAEAEQAHQYDRDDEAHEAARHEELHQIAMAPQSPNVQQQPDPVAMD